VLYSGAMLGSFCVIFLFLTLYQTGPIVGRGSRDEQGYAEKHILVAQGTNPPVQPGMQQPERRDAREGADSEHHVTDNAASNALAWAAIVLNCLLLIIVYYQARTYKRQLDVMRQTQDVLSRQANTLEAQVAAMENQTTAMREQLQVMRESLAETRRIFDLTERPVVIAVNARIDAGLTPDTPLMPAVTFANKGRTLAQDLRVTVEVAATRGAMYPFGFPDRGAHPTGGYLLPADGQIGITGAPVDAVTVDAEFLRSAGRGGEDFMIHGRATYRDLANREYDLRYAFRFDAIQAEFVQWPYPEPWPDRPQETNRTDD
jgi:outer membrane murein-binding lipoprotein Lpp